MQLHISNNSSIEIKFRKIFQTAPENNLITIPPSYGKGFIKPFRFSNNATALLFDCSLKESLRLTIESSNTFFLIMKIWSGDCSIVNQFKDLENKKLVNDSLFFGNINTELTITKNQIVRYWLITFDIKQLIQYFNFNQLNLFQRKFNLESNLVKKASDEMYEVVKSGIQKTDGFHFLYLHSKILTILYQVLIQIEQSTAVNTRSMNKKDLSKMNDVKKFIEENLFDLPNIKIIARNIGISESKLKRSFKRRFGKTLYQYSQHARMVKAKELLDSGQHNITEVAYLVGYSNTSHFSNSFKKYFEEIPSVYLQKEKLS